MPNPIPENIARLKEEYHKIKSVVTDDTWFMAINGFFISREITKLNSLIADLIEEVKRIRTRVKRQPSEYNLYVASEIKKGKTFLEAVENWNREVSEPQVLIKEEKGK